MTTQSDNFEVFCDSAKFMTYPFCVNCTNGTSMLYDAERRRSPAMSAKRAKSVSRSWSAKRGERRDSDKRISSNFLTSSNDGWNEKKKMEKIKFKFFYGYFLTIKQIKVQTFYKTKFRISRLTTAWQKKGLINFQKLAFGIDSLKSKFSCFKCIN